MTKMTKKEMLEEFVSFILTAVILYGALGLTIWTYLQR